MSNLTFNEEQYRSRSPKRTLERGGLIGLLIRKGWAKDARQATAILFCILAVCAIVLVVLYWPGGEQKTLTPTEIQQAGGPNDPGIYGN